MGCWQERRCDAVDGWTACFTDVRFQGFSLASVVFFIWIHASSTYTQMNKEAQINKDKRCTQTQGRLHKRTFCTATLRTKIKLILHNSTTTNVADKINGKSPYTVEFDHFPSFRCVLENAAHTCVVVCTMRRDTKRSISCMMYLH